MTQTIVKTQGNKQRVVVNAGIILAEIRRFYPTISLDVMAAKIGRSESALQRWARTGRARFKDMDALIAAYPEPDEDSRDKIVSAKNIPVDGTFCPNRRNNSNG